MSLHSVYAYSDLNRTTVIVDDGDIHYAGTWSSTGTYFSATKDAVLYGSTKYIALVDNVGGVPTYIPRRGQAKWSSLVVISQSGSESSAHTADEAYALAEAAAAAASSASETATAAAGSVAVASAQASQAFTIAVAGTSAAAVAQSQASAAASEAAAALTTANGASSVAVLALETAWSGTHGANTALTVATVGTEAATQAGARAYEALQTAWAGTAAAATAQTTADLAIFYTGTMSATGTDAYARDLAYAALQTAWAGTESAGAAQGTANTALTTAWAGTAAAATAQTTADLAIFYTGTLSSGSESLSKVSANRTYYVSTSGNDSNNGESVSSPFLTLQHAINTIANNLSIEYGVVVTIQLASGTYTLGSQVILAPFVGPGSVVIQGATGTASDVVITSSAISAQIRANLQDNYTLADMQFQASGGSPICIFASGGYIKISNIRFSSGLLAHLYATLGGKIEVVGNYSIIGGASWHYVADKHGVVDCVGSRTITLSGTPAFAGAFALAQHLGIVRSVSATHTGSATGPRYSALMNGVINTEGGGASYFPGNSSGATATGGQYA